MSLHCWLVPVPQVAWVSCVPSAVEAPGTSRQWPLATEVILQVPFVPAVNLHCWLAALWQVHWMIGAPGAVEAAFTSRHLPP